MKYLYLLALLLLISCSLPSPILTLKPASESGHWRNGYNIQTIDSNNIQVKSAFITDESNDLVFLIRIKNKSENEILFEPEKCFYMAYDKNKNFQQTIFAQNPTDKISYLEKRLENERTSHDNRTTADAIFGLVDIVSDISSIGQKKNREEREKEESEDEKRRIDQENSEYLHQERMGYLENKKYKWKNALRKHTILPNETISGKIYLRKIKNIFYLNLNILIDKVPLKFSYEINKSY